MSCLPTPPTILRHLACTSTDRKTRQDKQTDRQTQTDRQDSENHTQKTPTRAAHRKKKKTGRGGNLGGKGAEHDVRVEVVVRGRDEETQGESQTPEKGFGFPQHLRERERRENGVDETNQTTRERKRGQQTSGHTRVRS